MRIEAQKGQLAMAAQQAKMAAAQQSADQKRALQQFKPIQGGSAMITPLTIEQVRDDIVQAVEMLNGIPAEQRDDRMQQLLDDLEAALANYDAAEPTAA